MKKGFTLVEVVIVAAIMSIVLTGSFLVFSSAKQSWDTTEVRTALQLELRKAVLRMSDDLKQTSMSRLSTDPAANNTLAVNASISIGAVTPALYFDVPQGINYNDGSVNWNPARVSYTLVNGTIIRANGTTTSAIASDITSLNVTRLANDAIQIAVSGQKVKAVEHGTSTITASLESGVVLRN